MEQPCEGDLETVEFKWQFKVIGGSRAAKQRGTWEFLPSADVISPQPSAVLGLHPQSTMELILWTRHECPRQTLGQWAEGLRKEGTEEATAILGMVLSPGAQPYQASLWAAYKAWCDFCLCKYGLKGTNPQPRDCYHLNPFAYIFQMVIHSTQPPSTPPKAGLLKKKHLIW